MTKKLKRDCNCIPSNQLISTATGDIKISSVTLDDKIPDDLAQYNITNIWDAGKKVAYTVTASDGSSFKAASTHPVKVATDYGFTFKKVADLTPEDYLCKKSPTFFGKESVPDAFLIGALAASEELFITDSAIVFLVPHNHEIVSYFLETYKDDITIKNLSDTLDKIECSSKSLISTLKGFKILDGKSISFDILNFINTWDKESYKLFLKGFLRSSHIADESYGVRFAIPKSNNYKIGAQIQYLLYKFYVMAKLVECADTTILVIYDDYSLSKLSEHLDCDFPNPSNYVSYRIIPYVKTVIAAEMNFNDNLRQFISSELPDAYQILSNHSLLSNPEVHLNLDQVTAIYEFLGEGHSLRPYLTAKLSYDYVQFSDLDSSNEMEGMFDIEVDEIHEYNTLGFIVHNSNFSSIQKDNNFFF